ncbi:MFS transporter [Streptosporangium sp. NPDC051023]|uniref:MFS transporter n=1 Tax=Streptosporangium sp. NPDC051023 TaxID=3155410 RepID=UPI00344BF4E1
MQDETTAEAGPLAGRREWTGLAVLALPTLLIALDIGVLFLAVPHLSTGLGASSVEQLWIADIYGFLLAGFLITMGTLGDRIGRRRLLLIGAAAFGLASVLAAYSTSPGMLIAARAILGVAGATLMPSTLALLSNMFTNARQRGVAISLWAACQMGGAALGPVIGGLLLEHFWWGSVFLLGVPVMVLLLVLGPILLPEYRNQTPGKIDLVSVVMSLAAILPVIYGIKELAVSTVSTPIVPILAIVVGLAIGVAFVRRQLHLEHPLLDLHLFAEGTFSASLTAMLLAGGAQAGTFLLISQYVQSDLGYSPGQAGLWLAPQGLTMAVSAALAAPVVARKLGLSLAITGGLVLGAVGYVMIGLVPSVDGLPLIVIGGVVISIGLGQLFALGAGLVMGAVPPERAGSAASMSETSGNFGGTLGIAVMGTIGAAVYRAQVADSIPADVPADAAKAAHETLAGATAAAANLPAGPAAELLGAARDAFTNGLNTVGLIGAVLLLCLAVMIWLLFRKQRNQEGNPGGAEPAAETDVAQEVRTDH